MENMVLVTGGSGYIGSHTIIEIIRNTNWNVISVDNFLNSSHDTFERIEDITGKKVLNYDIDLCEAGALERVFKNHPDINGIIHFAALKSVPDSVENPILYYRNNINSLLNILESSDKFGIKNFIFSSSCSVYGNVEKLPVNEDTPFGKPESPYAYTKQIGEEIIKDFTEVSDMQSVTLRYFNPVGADISGKIGENPKNKANNLIPVITQNAAGFLTELNVFGNDYNTRDGTCIRDYVHVSDIADAHIKAMQRLLLSKNKNNFEVYNLGTGEGVSVLEALHTFEKVTNIKLKYKIVARRPGDVAAIYSDCKKSLDELDWKPKYNVEQMMETAWKWQKNIISSEVDDYK